MSIIPLKSNTILHNRRFQIIKKIGSGGFGITYLAQDLNLNVKCVIKEFAFAQICSRDPRNSTVLTHEGHEKKMAKWTGKFILEAQNLAKIKHSGIVAVLDVWPEKGTVYYAMEYLEGGELPSPSDENWHARSWFEIKDLAIALLEALREVHNAGLLHGDIKPANILVRKDGKPVLIDFGTARSLATAKDLTVTTVMYTSGYAPLELQNRSRSKETGPCSDLYSWAMVVIGMLSKFPHRNYPTDAETRQIMFSDTKQDKYNEKSLRKWLPSAVPKSVISILADCLQIEAKHRPQSVNAVLSRFQTSKLPDTEVEEDESENKPVKNKQMLTFVLIGIIGIVGIVVGTIEITLFLSEKGPNSANLNAEIHEEDPNSADLNEKETPNSVPAVFCAENEHVLNNICTTCSAGSTNEAGDDASNSNTICDPILCAENEHVLNNICQVCAVGSTNEAGDDASNSDTICDPILCAENEYVRSHLCETCSAGSTNEAGDDASNSDTICDPPEGFALIPAGSFMMGSSSNESRRDNDEGPQHEVTITRPFYMQIHEVTQREWRALMGNNPSRFSSSGDGANCGSNCPVEQVNWYEALAYANALSNSKGLQECYILSNCNGNSPGNDMECTNILQISNCLGYRLPTEAEWEYAARGGTTTAYYNGNDPNELDEIAWFGESWSLGSTHPVGRKDPNSWGLFDMSGNVWEWCWDWYESDYYSSSPTNDPLGPESGSYRVLRGGSWNFSASSARSASRNRGAPGNRTRNFGFRLVSSAP